MPTDFRSGSMNYSDAERVRKAAAGYGGMGTLTPEPNVKHSMMTQMHRAIKQQGSVPDAPVVETIKKGHSPEDI